MLNGITVADKQLRVSPARSSINVPTMQFAAAAGGAATTGAQPQAAMTAYGMAAMPGVPSLGGYAPQYQAQYQAQAASMAAYGMAGGMGMQMPGMGMQAGMHMQVPAHAEAHKAKMRTYDPEKVKRTVHVANLDVGITEEHLAQYFSACGALVAIRTSGGLTAQPRFAWIEFGSEQSAQAAVGLTGQTLGTQQLRIQISRSAIQNATWKAEDATGGAPAAAPVAVAEAEPAQAGAIPADAETAADAATVASPTAEAVVEPAAIAATAEATEPTAPAPAGPEVAAHVYDVDASVEAAAVSAFFAERVGRVVAIELLAIAEGKSTREAIVAFESAENAKSAMSLSGMQLGATSISVGPATRRPADASEGAAVGTKRAAEDVASLGGDVEAKRAKAEDDA